MLQLLLWQDGLQCFIHGAGSNDGFLAPDQTFLTACALQAARGAEARVDRIEAGQGVRSGKAYVLGSVRERREGVES